jgi:hypothetical protein
MCIPLTIILGNKGGGKGLWMVLTALQTKKQIWSNFKLKDRLEKRYHELRVIDLMDEDLPNDAMIFIDELYNWIDSRTSGSAFNLYSSHIAYELRHTKRQILGTTLKLHSIEMRWREEWDYIVKAQRVPHLATQYKIPEGSPEWEFWGFRWEIYNKRQDTFTAYEMSYDNARKYFTLYDTTQIIPPYNKAELEFRILEKNPELLTERVKKVAPIVRDYIKENFERITHATTHIALQELGYVQGYHSYIYNRIREDTYHQ